MVEPTDPAQRRSFGRSLNWGAYDLVRLSEVEPADVDRAERLWREANRGTGLEGLLGAESRGEG